MYRFGEASGGPEAMAEKSFQVLDTAVFLLGKD
jgi:hypothetical protein